MTDKQKAETLYKAFTKAIKQGWFHIPYLGTEWDNATKEKKLKMLESYLIHDGRYRAIIYEHSFAKPLWGIEKSELALVDGSPLYTNNFQIFKYQYHLKEMAVSDSDLEYLKENI